MPVSYFLAPIPRWQFTKNDSLYNVKGKLYTYRALAHDEEKPTYQDMGGTLPYTNPIILDGVGSIGPIYWANDEYYYIELRDENDALIWSVDNFPDTGSGSSPISVEVDHDNQIMNGQFRFHNAAILSGFAAATEYNIAQAWSFYKDNATATDKISFVEFLPGSPPSSIEGNPQYYLSYECTVAGTAESSKYIFQPIPDVRTFSGKEITFAIVAKAGVNTTIPIEIVQYFGTGGSPSPINIISFGSINLTTSWNKFFLTGTVDSISGQTIGTNKDDRIEIRIGLPTNTTCIIDLENVQINIGNKQLEYQYTQPEQEFSKSFPAILERRSQYWQDPYGDYPLEQQEYAVLGRNASLPNWYNVYNASAINLLVVPPAGSIIMWPTEIIPPDYLLCDGSYKPSWKYPRLYTAIANRYTSSTSTHTATAIVSSADVTVTMSANGAVTHASDVNTGFTFTVIQNGDATHPEIFKITCTSGASLTGGEHFTFMHPDLTPCLCWLCVDGNYLKKPIIPGGTTEYKVYIRSTDAANQIAAKIQLIFNRTTFGLPDPRGLFIRGTDSGAGNDPDRLTRTARPDGAAGDVVGTKQLDEYKNHTHTITTYDKLQSAGQTFADRWTETAPGNTGGSGGQETRGKNIGFNFIIKY